MAAVAITLACLGGGLLNLSDIDMAVTIYIELSVNNDSVETAKNGTGAAKYL